MGGWGPGFWGAMEFGSSAFQLWEPPGPPSLSTVGGGQHGGPPFHSPGEALVCSPSCCRVGGWASLNGGWASLQGSGWIRWGWAGVLPCDKNVTRTMLGPDVQRKAWEL